MDAECWVKTIDYFIEMMPRARVAGNMNPWTNPDELPWLILFFDNLRSHVNNADIHDKLRNQHIQPITFMPNTTDYAQPIDQEIGSANKVSRQNA